MYPTVSIIIYYLYAAMYLLLLYSDISEINNNKLYLYSYSDHRRLKKTSFLYQRQT